MRDYLVLVELLGSDTYDYTKLHKLMAKSGFVRGINDEGGIFRLLPGQYHRESDLSLKEIIEEARTTAEQVKPNPRILVTQGEFAHYNLIKGREENL